MEKIILVFALFVLASCGSEQKQVSEKALPRLKPVDVYLNLEKNGFKTSKDFTSEVKKYVCDYEDNSFKYQVDLFSTNHDDVTYLRSLVTLQNTDVSISEAMVFLKSMADIRFDGVDVSVVQAFIERNYNEPIKDTTIASINYKVAAPSKLVRLLYIQKSI